MEEILQQALRLSVPERLELVTSIIEACQEKEKSNTQNRLDYYMQAMEKALGKPINFHSHVPEYVWARSFLSYELSRSGVKNSDIAKFLHKDRVTLKNMYKTASMIISSPKMYLDAIGLYARFLRYLETEHTQEDNLM